MTYDCQLKCLKHHSLEHRRLILSLCTFYKIYYKLVFCDIVGQFHASLLQLRDHYHKLFVPFVVVVLGKNYFVFRMLLIWNELLRPNVIGCSNVFTAFKRRLNGHDLSKYLR